MTPEEVQQVTTSIVEALGSVDVSVPEGSNGYIYVLISLVPTFFLLGRQFKKAFVKAIEKVLESHTKEMIVLIEDMNGIKIEHNELKIKVDENHRSILEKISDKCNPHESNSN